jgi:uncharacterized Zn-finger protein
MKKRFGFVSNSSSSSFIATKNDFQSSFDIAIEMIPIRDYEDDYELVEKVKELGDLLPQDTNITFSSTNYETYIYSYNFKGEDIYVIDTCNNHFFQDVCGLRRVPEQIEDEMVERGLTQRQQFYDVELDLQYQVLSCDDEEEAFCSKHGKFFVRLLDGEDRGEIVCPCCYAEERSKKMPISVYHRNVNSKINFNSEVERSQLKIF